MDNEANTEDRVILPLLERWGYQSSEYQAKPRLKEGYPDFLVTLPRVGDRPLNYLIIEVKTPSKSPLTGSQQLRRYMEAAHAVFGLLTNGREYQLFYQNPLKAPLQQVRCASGLLDKETLQRLSKILHRSTASALVAALTHRQLEIYRRFEKGLAKNFSSLSVSSKASNFKESSMIITVFNHKGGVGKTTLTLNLGAAFASMGKRVLLIDIDPQSNLTVGAGIDPLVDVEEQGRKDIVDLLLEPKVSLQDVVYQREWGNLRLDIVPAHIRLADKEPELVGTIDVDRVLKRKLKDHGYDIVLIDPPPAFGKVNAIALMASDGVLIPSQLAPYPIRAIEYVLARLEAISNAMETPPRPLGIAVNMYNRKTSAANYEMKQKLLKIVEKTAHTGHAVPILPESTWIANLVVMLRATEFQQPIFSRALYEKLSRADRESIDYLITSFENLARYLSSQSL
ncbi:MAG: AAA family ATPase [Thermosynechococcus sp. Uc]|uniref:AAA family ATPase n=1 Tax=Thermosynechococcus sp. Uc TaxID=3034853 RepID=UPI0019E72F3F|nr:AAA family ATPase [Thermosynechococcus sp. Uc]MDM7327686.1 AAA family ATPase [Thermosynechococcus sp. Uc]HIK25848.1 AAA family ATPase [Thermosynechococcus sp. M46_R2017_013]